ncbi:MAG TPA: zinc ribbon domain-containing protein [Pyrinomonadaceae bacterium]|nr:zinc ribbon domain-containing protein [Pyrinomonadaceae bacterium]
MDDKMRCQSCGMPLSAEFGNHGTNADGSANQKYCSICYKDGAFNNPNQTLPEMIQSSIENMTADLNMPKNAASELANSFIPTLKRWQNA